MHDSSDPLLSLPTRVLAVASHISDKTSSKLKVVHGYVGNTMAAFVMQVLGYEVAALNTVQFSNHTGYGQFKGTRASAQDIQDIYDGLKESYLTDFDVLLSGYAPSADAVQAVGAIARDLMLNATKKPGSFFWVLDPVMGDEGHLYVQEDVVPVYKNLLCDADLILPNQFEAETLSGHVITSLPTLIAAISTLHKTHQIPHIIITSVRLPSSSDTISIVGSTASSDYSPRLFKIDVPALDCFFSGTGDMFAALILVRLREAAQAASLGAVKSWISPDEVRGVELPLAKAAEKVMGSMHAVLVETKRTRDCLLQQGFTNGDTDTHQGAQERMRLGEVKAAEVRVVQCLEELRSPKIIFRAEPVFWNE